LSSAVLPLETDQVCEPLSSMEIRRSSASYLIHVIPETGSVIVVNRGAAAIVEDHATRGRDDLLQPVDRPAGTQG
jgi:hypothetical protein